MAIPEYEPGREGSGAEVPAVSRAADHAMGLELQIEELEEQRARADVQGRREDAARLDQEMGVLQAELARTAEAAVAALDRAGGATGVGGDPRGASPSQPRVALGDEPGP